MFRVIVEFTDKPMFWLICDNRTCGCSARGEVDQSSQEAMLKSQQAFLSAAIKDGWIVGLDAQICPPHAQRMKDLAEQKAKEGKRIVEPAGVFDDLKFKAKDGKIAIVKQ